MISPSVSGGSCDVEVLIRSGGHLLTVSCFHILVVLLTDGGTHTYAGVTGQVGSWDLNLLPQMPLSSTPGSDESGCFTFPRNCALYVSHCIPT